VVTGICAGERKDRKMISKSDQISNLSAALLKAQKAIGHALKSAENPYFKSRYADLTIVIDSVKEPLNNNGITFIQAVDENGEGRPVIDTILLHESGQYLSTRTPVFCNKPNDPQAFGSGVTYSKRYALQAILGLPTEDDDAEAATARGKSNKNNSQSASWGYQKPDKPKEVSKEDREKLVDQAWFNFQTVHKDEMPDGQIFKEEYFVNEWKEQYKKLTAHQKKTFKWNQEEVNKIAEKVLPKNCLTDIKVAPDA
jgi:hypothetical protein